MIFASVDLEIYPYKSLKDERRRKMFPNVVEHRGCKVWRNR
jgi:hypothetical protein